MYIYFHIHANNKFVNFWLANILFAHDLNEHDLLVQPVHFLYQKTEEKKVKAQQITYIKIIPALSIACNTNVKNIWKLHIRSGIALKWFKSYWKICCWCKHVVFPVYSVHV